MILIKITKENREPEVGEWYWHHRANTYSKRLDRIRFHKFNKALSLSVILDAPETTQHNTAYIEHNLDRYPISNSEEIFQWLHDKGKLGEEWVEWEGDHLFDWDDSVILRSTDKQCTCPAPLIRGVNPEYCGICEKDICQSLDCDETYTDWSNRLFTHMAENHDINLTDTEMQDIYSCIVKFDPDKETKRFNT